MEGVHRNMPLCQDLDFITACNIAYGYLLNTYSSVTDFGALILKIENGSYLSVLSTYHGKGRVEKGGERWE